MSVTPGEFDPREEDGDSRRIALQAVREAREAFRSVVDFDMPSEARFTVEQALEKAEAVLDTAASECRLDTPYAPLIQVGDGSGLHWECTHSPTPHRF